MSVFDDDRLQRAVTTATKNCYTRSRGYVAFDDIRQELYAWVASNEDRVVEYLDMGQHGYGKLMTALNREASLHVHRERRRRTGAGPNDAAYYTAGMIEDMLPDVWTYSSWQRTSQPDRDDVRRTPSRPAEGNTRLAQMSDLAFAIGRLTAEDRGFLRLRWADGGNTWAEVARFYDVTPEAARRRGERMVRKLIDWLGGPPPWWTPGRKARSNAAAQADLRRQSG